MKQLVVVFDGHDGAGKTTVARAFASAMQEDYVKPFDSDFGDMLVWLLRRKEFELLSHTARAMTRFSLVLSVVPQCNRCAEQV